MDKIQKLICALLFAILLPIVLSDCKNSNQEPDKKTPKYASFRDIPGITQDEIKAIEALQKQRTSFVYGMVPSTESFRNADGEIRGYAALVCEWLSELFGIPFIPKNYTWNGLLKGVASAEIDFTGHMMRTDKRQEVYYMTDPIAQRPVKYFRIAGSKPLSEIEQKRLPRYALIKDAATTANVFRYAEKKFEPVFISEYIDAYKLLKTGKADAFIMIGIVETVFENFGDVVTTDFLPLIFASASFATQNPELAPIISVVQKALENDAIRHLNKLYRQGYQEYMKHKLFLRLNKEELSYLNTNSVIPFVADYDNYPINFYNIREKKWQGIAFDVLREVEALTGLKFKLINDRYAEFPELLQMLEDGDALLISELVHTPARQGRFAWPNYAFFTDQAVLISKTEYPNIGINEVLSVKVGLSKDTVNTELFYRWFPNHTHIVEYESQSEAFDALMRDDVDMVMNSYSSLLHLTNYMEFPGFKANIIFDNKFESTFGFNKDAAVLCSIFDKTLELIDTEMISEQWLRKTYDYRAKLAHDRLPWIIGTICLLLLILVILATLGVIYIKRRNTIAEQIYANKLRNTLTNITKSPALTAGILKDAADAIAQEGCRALDTHRATVWTVSEDASALNNVSTYDIATGKHSVQGDFDLLSRKEYTELLKSERLIITNDVRKSDTLSDLTDEYGPNLVAVLDAPIRIDGKLAGVVCVEQDSCKAFPEKREWTIEEQNFTSSLADLMALAITGAERRIARDAAESASRSKSAFLANMSHEMRTPMNVVVGLTSLMLEEDDPAVNLEENLRKISTAGSALLGLINDVLDISKIEAGKLELLPVQYELPSLLNDIIILNIIRIEDKPVTFRLDINERLPYTLYGDDLRVKQIINNILSNAFKYTHEGAVTLGINCEYERDGNVRLSIYVSDTGIGIREEDIKKLFTDYSQVDTLANRRLEGTGLGLSITKMLVEHMNGEISVESEYGKGTTFRLHIRQGFVSDKTIGAELAESLCSFRYLDRRKRAHERLVRPDLSYASVLVVDDMQTNLDVAAGMLKKYKMRVDCVTSGQEAISRIKEGEPVYDAIFMDHMMPDMDGVEATKEIRSLGTRYAETVPIIALTANAIAGNEQMFLSNDFQDFLAKPINIMNLDSIVQKWVRNKSRE